MDWNYISQFHKNPPNIRLYREETIQHKYDKNRQSSDYSIGLFNRIFDSNQETVLTINEYPYHFIDNTQHYIYWTQGTIDYNKLEEELKDLGKEYIYFENLKGNKSIKNINHVHVFIKD